MTESIFAHYWRGHGRLWKVYWLYGVLGSMILFGIYLALSASGIRLPLLQFAILLGFAGYTVWILVSVWRCAFNVKNDFYGHLARGLTIAWAINATLILLFLELDVLGDLF